MQQSLYKKKKNKKKQHTKKKLYKDKISDALVVVLYPYPQVKRLRDEVDSLKGVFTMRMILSDFISDFLLFFSFRFSFIFVVEGGFSIVHLALLLPSFPLAIPIFIFLNIHATYTGKRRQGAHSK